MSLQTQVDTLTSTVALLMDKFDQFHFNQTTFQKDQKRLIEQTTVDLNARLNLVKNEKQDHFFNLDRQITDIHARLDSVDGKLMEIPILHEKNDQTRKFMSDMRDEYDRFKAEASFKLSIHANRQSAPSSYLVSPADRNPAATSGINTTANLSEQFI